MLNQLAQGWRLVALNKRTFLLISMYQLLWTVLLYFMIERIVSPILRALPSQGTSAAATQYYWLEIRFLAAKTELLLPYLYIVAALLLIRMAFTPFIQGGIFGALAKSRQEQAHNQFFKELKTNWKPFLLLYWIKTLSIAVPLIMVLLPSVKPLLEQYFTFPVKEVTLFPIMMLALWSIIVSALIYGILLGRVSQLSWQKTLTTLITQALKLLAVALFIAAILLVGHFIFQLSTLFISGLLSTILFFILPIVRTFLKAWSVSTHLIQFEQ